jgi:hypothetical protein
MVIREFYIICYILLHSSTLPRQAVHPPFQGCVLLNVLPVLVQCGSSNALQLPPRESRFDEVGDVQATTTTTTTSANSTRTHQCMHFINPAATDGSGGQTTQQETELQRTHQHAIMSNQPIND